MPIGIRGEGPHLRVGGTEQSVPVRPLPSRSRGRRRGDVKWRGGDGGGSVVYCGGGVVARVCLGDSLPPPSATDPPRDGGASESNKLNNNLFLFLFL